MKAMWLIAAALLLAGCTPNESARVYGGTETFSVPTGKKVVNVTWKDTDLWILWRDRRPDEKPEVYEFKEKSTYGVLEGSVKLIEQ